MHVGRDGLLSWPANNFNLHYKSGATNIEADCLSRIQWPDVLNQTEESRFQHLPYTSMQAIIQGISPQIILADSIILNKQVIPVDCYVANQPGTYQRGLEATAIC